MGKRKQQVLLKNLSSTTLRLGFTGENVHTEITFNCIEIYTDYPNAVATMLVQPPRGDVYPASISRDGNLVIWSITNSDVAYAGNGRIQLTFTNGSEVIKTYIAGITIDSSIEGAGGDPPDPYESWMETLDEAKAEAEAAAESIEDLTVSATSGTPVNATVSDVSGHKHIAFTFPAYGMDNVPTANSDNVVKSGGIKTAIDAVSITLNSRVPAPSAAGKFLQTDSNGNSTWGAAASPTDVVNAVEDWMDENITGATGAVVIDSSLSVQGAAAESKTVGDALSSQGEEIGNVKSAINSLECGIEDLPEEKLPSSDSDLDVTDESGNVLVRFEDGHVKTKEFNSSDIRTSGLNNDAGFYNKYTLPVDGTTNKGSSDTADLSLTDEDGNAIVQFVGGHIRTKEFDSDDIKTSELDNDAGFAMESGCNNRKASGTADLDITDESGNVIVQFINGHIKTKEFDSSQASEGAVMTINGDPPDENGNVNVYPQIDPEDIGDAVADYLDEHPVVAAACGMVSVADYNAAGDGETDDSAAIQQAFDEADDIYFESGKTYCLASTLTTHRSIRLHGGEGTVIKVIPDGSNVLHYAISVTGTKKKTTTLTSNYLSAGDHTNDNAGNRITLADMSNVAIGDLLYIRAEDQYYSYARQYYYLGATLKVVDVYDGHIYVDRSMPYDIQLTNDVIVEVYDAPVVEVHGIKFEGVIDGETGLSLSPALLYLGFCKNVSIRNVEFTKSRVGISLQNCVNSVIDGVSFSKIKPVNLVNGTSPYDGYGIHVGSCTNTTLKRIVCLAGQSSISTGGRVPCLDTFVLRCHMISEARETAIGMHENSYNIVIEDCVLSGATLYGTVTVHRCKFIKNNRIDNTEVAITFRGSHDARFASLYVSECEFENGSLIDLRSPAPQNPIQSMDHIIDSVTIEHCKNGALRYYPSVSNFILSNCLNRVAINDWKNMKCINHDPDQQIKMITIRNTSFAMDAWIANMGGTYSTGGIDKLLLQNDLPPYSRMIVGMDTYGTKYRMPEGVPVNFESEEQSALYILCGENCASSAVSDYGVGSVSEGTGGVISVVPDAGLASCLTAQDANTIKFTQPNNTNKYTIFPLYMLAAEEKVTVRASAKLKKAGSASGAGFVMKIFVVNGDTGVISDTQSSSSVTATDGGASVSVSATITSGYRALCCLYCGSPVANAETILEELLFSTALPTEPAPVYKAYAGNHRTGDGALYSQNGFNNMLSSAFVFHVTTDAIC